MFASVAVIRGVSVGVVCSGNAAKMYKNVFGFGARFPYSAVESNANTRRERERERGGGGEDEGARI